MIVALLLVGPIIIAAFSDERSASTHVDPWDVVVDYDFSTSQTAREANIHVLDKAVRLAQKDIKYFEEEKKPWEEHEPDEYQVKGFNYTAWNRTYIRPPKNFGDKQTAKIMSSMTLPEFDITKIKLKPDNKNNNSVVFGVVLKMGLENKIIGYSSKRLHVQIQAPNYLGAADNELARFLSRVLGVPRKLIKVKQGAGQNIRKVRIPKIAIQEKVYLKKLIMELDLERVTRRPRRTIIKGSHEDFSSS